MFDLCNFDLQHASSFLVRSRMITFLVASHLMCDSKRQSCLVRAETPLKTHEIKLKEQEAGEDMRSLEHTSWRKSKQGVWSGKKSHPKGP